MKQQFTYFILFVWLGCFAQNRQNELDSLLVVTKSTSNKPDKASAHGRLAWLFLSKDISKSQAHLDSAKVLFSSLKDEKGIAIVNYKYGVLNRVSGNYDEALSYLNKYQEYVERQQDTFKTANSLFQKGVVYSLQGDYETSLIYYYKTLSFYDKLKDSTGMGFTLNSIGIVYKNLKKYDKALESFQQAVTIHGKKNDLNNLANVYNGIGDVYAEQKNFDKALEYFGKTLTIDNEISNNWGTAKVSKNIALIYIENQQYNKALAYLNNALNIQKTHNYNSEIPETLAQLSQVHRHLGNYKKSESLLQQGFQNEIPSNKVYQEMHWQSYKLFEVIGNSKKALHHHKQYITYKDSIFNKDNLKNINTLEIQFETEKKDKELAQQELLINENENALQKKQNQYSIMTAITIFLLLSSLLTWLIFKQRQKRKNQEILTLKREHQIITLETLIEGEEKERLRIAKELHDGVNGDLSAIKFKLVSLQEMNNKVINEAVEMIDKSCQQVRAISHNLIPPSLESFNLIEATETFCHNMNTAHDAKIEFHSIGDAITISKKEEVNIFRIIQELVTNAIKHAEASEINVQISHRDQIIHITVEDDGKGFNVDEDATDGIGLKNIQSRVDYLQAEFDVVSNTEGSSFTIEIDKSKHNDH